MRQKKDGKSKTWRKSSKSRLTERKGLGRIGRRRDRFACFAYCLTFGYICIICLFFSVFWKNDKKHTSLKNVLFWQKDKICHNNLNTLLWHRYRKCHNDIKGINVIDIIFCYKLLTYYGYGTILYQNPSE